MTSPPRRQDEATLLTAEPKDVLGIVEERSEIDVWRPLRANVLDALRVATEQFPQKPVRFIDRAVDPRLETLKGFEHLQVLSIQSSWPTSFDVLGGFTKLRKLGLADTHSKKVSLSFLKNCSELVELRLEGHSQGLEDLIELSNLKLLWLTSSRILSFEVLANHPAIERLGVQSSKVRDLSPLASMGHLRSLWIARISKLCGTDLAPLANSSVRLLALNYLPWIEDFGSLDRPEITHLSLDNLSRLRSLAALADWPVLAILGLRQAKPTEHDLVTVCQNPSLRQLTIGQSLPRAELGQIQEKFQGDALRYSGSTLRGDPFRGAIVSSVDL